MVLENASAQMAQGLLELSVSDLLGAAKLVREIEKEDSDIDEAVFFAQAMAVVMQEAQASMASMDFDALVWRLQTNPVMQDIIRKVRGEDEPAPIQTTVEAIEAKSSPSVDMSVIA